MFLEIFALSLNNVSFDSRKGNTSVYIAYKGKYTLNFYIMFQKHDCEKRYHVVSLMLYLDLLET